MKLDSKTTNGLLLNVGFLEDLKEAGLDMVMLHIDEEQNRPDLPPDPTLEQINSLRSALAEKVAARDIDVGLSVTVYRKYFDRLPQIVDYILNSRHINFLFATNYVDTANLLKSVHFMQQNQDRFPDGTDGSLSQSTRTTNQQVYEILKDSFAIEPSAYLPPARATAGAEGHMAWMTYFMPVIHLENKTERFSIRSNIINLFLRSFSKLTTGRFTFYSGNKPFTTAVMVLCSTLTSRRPIEGLKFLAKLRHSGARLKSKYLIFENGPMVTENGDISCCVLCPNATVSGNRLVPVCLADYPDFNSMDGLSSG